MFPFLRLDVLPFIFILSFLLMSFSSSATPIFFNKIPVTLTDASTKEPIIGANIYTEDFSFNTTTDFDGKAIIEGLKYRDEVVISYIGYKTLTIPVYEIRRRKGQIALEVDAVELAGVEVVGRRDDRIEELPYQIERIVSKDIAFNNAQTAADVLDKNGGLFVQKSQMGGGSPIIRGFEANRVLLVVDGVKMNNAIYRSGHLQNAITVDPAMLEQAEVIYGPGSLTYGSDALGGVVHYRTKDPKLAMGEEKYISETNMYTRYSTANVEKAVHIDFSQGSKKWGSFSSLSFVDYDNLIAGSVRPEAFPKFGRQEYTAVIFADNSLGEVRDNVEKPNRQWGTAYGQIDFLQKIKFQPSDNINFIANLQYSSSTNIPRYDNLVDTVGTARDLKWIDWYYGPQQRILASLKTRILDKAFFDKATIIASFQRVDEDQYSRKFNSEWRSATETDVFVYSLTADFDKYLDEEENLNISYGVDLSRNDVLSRAYDRNVKNAKSHLVQVEGPDIITRYPSQGSIMDSYGAYVNAKWKSENEKLSAEGGMRYSIVQILSKFGANDPIAWPQNYIDGIRLNNSALTYGAGVTYQMENKWQFRALAATAFRSPNVDDFAKIREKNGYITVPNPGLTPEKAFTVEGTIAKEFGQVEMNQETKKKIGRSLKISTTVFRTGLKDALVRKNFALPDGTNTLLKDNEILEIQANVNAERATVYGFSGTLTFNLADKLILSSNLNFTKGSSNFKDNIEGIVVDTIVPFAHIPPMYGRTSLTYQLGKLKLSGVIRYNGRKRPTDYAVSSVNVNSFGELIFNRTGTSDNIDYTPYGFVDGNGDPCIAVGGRDQTINCTQNYAGSLAWTTYNFYSDYQINDKLAVNFAVENILNLHYRPFSSGVSSPGRNFVIGLRGSF